VVTKEATCVETGIKTFTCTASDCNETKTEEIPKLSHTLETIPTVEATCTTDGATAGEKCAVCNEIITAPTVLPAKGHIAVTIPAVEPSCTKPGATEGVQCAVCDTILEEPETIAALGHTWDAGSITKAATVTAEGIKTYICTVCSTTKTESVPKLAVLPNVTINKTVAHKTGNILYWDKVDGAKFYQIFRRTSGKSFEWVANTSGLAYKDTTAEAGVSYIYAIKAYNNGVRSADYSNQRTVTRPLGIVNISKTNAHKTGNILYWDKVDGARFYQVFRRTSGKNFEWVANTGGTAYKDTTAQAGVTYIYAIKAYNNGIRSDSYSNQVTMTRPKS
jgi:hypothetical protein